MGSQSGLRDADRWMIKARMSSGKSISARQPREGLLVADAQPVGLKGTQGKAGRGRG